MYKSKSHQHRPQITKHAQKINLDSGTSSKARTGASSYTGRKNPNSSGCLSENMDLERPWHLWFYGVLYFDSWHESWIRLFKTYWSTSILHCFLLPPRPILQGGAPPSCPFGIKKPCSAAKSHCKAIISNEVTRKRFQHQTSYKRNTRKPYNMM